MACVSFFCILLLSLIRNTVVMSVLDVVGGRETTDTVVSSVWEGGAPVRPYMESRYSFVSGQCRDKPHPSCLLLELSKLLMHRVIGQELKVGRVGGADSNIIGHARKW